MKYLNLTTKQAFYIAKALKVKHNIPITKSLKQTNFNEFYESINKNILCDSKILEYLFKTINKVNEDVLNLLQEGKKVRSEEKFFKNLNWSQIISNLKTQFKATNKNLEKLTGCNHKSIGEWERGTKTPNYNNYKILVKFIHSNNLNLERLSNLKGKKHTYKSKYKNLKPLRLTPELAEFIGILNGDGSISKGGLMEITGNHIEDILHHKKRINFLIEKLFNKKVLHREKNSVMASGFTSLQISKQLNQIGLPIGKKINLRIPVKILENKNLLKHYLRGLFDTDGTICRRNKYNLRIGYGSFKGKKFTKDVLLALQKLGFNPNFVDYKNKFRVDIANDIEVILFFKKVGSSNYSKIARFLYWKLNHNCPSNSYNEFKLRLKDQHLNIKKVNLPFLWNEKYVNSQNPDLQKILFSKLKEDNIKLDITNIRKKINWKERISFLKTIKNLKSLKEEFGCSHSVIWQWQTGKRIPNLEMCVRIKRFCDENKIDLI